MRAKSIYAVAVLISISVLACSIDDLISGGTIDQVATSVVATMAAIGGSPEATSPAPATSEPTIAPPPPPTAAPPAVLRIVYSDNGNVWLIEEANPPVQLTSSGDVSEILISDDGMKVAFIRYDMATQAVEIRSVNIDGSGEIVLLSQVQYDALYPLGDALHNAPLQVAFVPGTHNLLLNSRALFDGPGLFQYEDLIQLNADTGALAIILPAEMGGEFAISPDGSQVALVRPTTIGLVNTDGTNLRPDLVAFSMVITYSEFLYHPKPVWRQDSSAVGVAIPSGDPLAPAPSGTIWRIPADGSPPVNLATIPGGFYFPQFSLTLLSQDLAKVAYLRDTATPNVRNLFIANADGTGEVLFATGEIFWQGWNPDSTHFVYSIGTMDLRLGAIGEAPVLLGTGTRFRWIDDDEYLFLSGSVGGWTLLKGQVGAGNVPVVSPVGDFVVYDFDR